MAASRTNNSCWRGAGSSKPIPPGQRKTARVLRKTEDRASIVVCNTCRFSNAAREDSQGRRGGALLAEELKRLAGDAVVEEMACLFGCARHCAVHLRAPGKIGYVLGDFRPGEGSAQAILDFFRLYRMSAFGAVPYSQWPEGIKGHFIVRFPPPGYSVDADG